MKQLPIDYSKSVFQVYSDVLRFWQSSIPMEMSDRLLSLSRLLQESFKKPEELNEGSEEYIRGDNGFQTGRPLISMMGSRIGVITKLEQVLTSKKLLEAQAKLPHHFQRKTHLNEIRQTSTIVPIQSQISFAS